MWWQPADKEPDRPTVSIVLVIAFQSLVGVLTLLLAAKEAWFEYSDQAYPDPGTPQSLGIMFAIGALWIACAIGLFNLRNWARWLSLVLASIALIAGGLGMLFYKRQAGFDFGPFFFEMLTKVSAVVSAWWWLLFTRKGVCEQFH